MNRIRWYGPTIVLLIAATMLMVLGPRLTQRLAHVRKMEEIRLVRDTLQRNGALAQLSDAFRQVADAVKPSVVYIQVSTRQDPRRQLPDELRRFFGPPAIPGLPEIPEEQEGTPPSDEFDRYNVPRPTGSGSGWVFDEQGHIITNNHVVTGRDRTTRAERITVRFADGNEYEATIVGTDPKTDVAVLKVIGGGKFIPARIAEEVEEQGDIVFAFGSPFQYEFSMSQGIVSAKGRHIGILEQGGYENFIQTDAAINPGNSGGPLTNIYGEVIGMNTLIASRTGAFNGLGFAIPAALIRDVALQLIEGGKVTRGFLGITIDDLNPRMARTFGFDGRGVLVIEPMEGTPAAAAGLRGGDIVTKVDGKPVSTAQELRFRVADKRPGAMVKLEVFREGETLNIDVAVAEMTDEMLARARGGNESSAAVPAEGQQLLRKVGLESVRAFTSELADELRVPFSEGVIVEQVRRNSAAAAAGLMPRTIITNVMGVPVKTPAELADELARRNLQDGVRLRVLNPTRDRRLVSGYVLLELPSE